MLLETVVGGHTVGPMAHGGFCHLWVFGSTPSSSIEIFPILMGCVDTPKIKPPYVQLSLGRLYFWDINTTHKNVAKFNRTTWLGAKDPNGAKPFLGMAGTAGPLQLFPATSDVTAPSK